MIFCAAARKLKNITKSRFCQRKILLCSLCMYVFLKPVALPKGDTHTRTPNFRSFCALPFAAFRRIDFAGVCLLESVLLSADNKWILNPYLFVVFVCSYFLPKGGIKNSHFASLFNTHKIHIIYTHKNENGSDDSTKNPRRVQRLLRYVLSLSSSFGLKPGLVVVAQGGPFFTKANFPRKQILSSSFN